METEETVDDAGGDELSHALGLGVFVERVCLEPDAGLLPALSWLAWELDEEEEGMTAGVDVD